MRRSILRAALCAIFLSVSVSTFGQTDRPAKLAALTSEIREKAAHGRSGDTSFSSAARSRFKLMSQLAQTDPRAVLDNALSDEILSRVPSNAKGYFESRESLNGELEVLAECDEHDGRIHRTLKQGDDLTSLYFAGEPSDDLLTGAQVNAMGVLIGDRMVLEADGMTSAATKTISETTASALTGATGEVKVLVLLVNFQNDTRQPYTIEQSNNLMFNTANTSSVTNYYREASYGQTWVTGDTRGWYTLDLNATCDYGLIASKSKQAATAAGVNLSSYQRYMYVFPDMACGWNGLGSVGGNETWINGSHRLRTSAHELGHNAGLHHSASMSCDGGVIGGNCTTYAYGHTADMMGSCTGHFQPFQKERLGWLSTPMITNSGTYFISPMSINDLAPKSLKILKSTDSSGRKTWYHFEFRQPLGFDSCLNQYYQSNLTKGLLVTMNNESDGRENYQLDMNPQTTRIEDSALIAGQTYTDPGAGFSITPISVSAAGVYVQVSFGSNPPPPTPTPSPSPMPSCVNASPTVSVSPATTQWIPSGGSANYSVSVTNNNGSSCSSNSFNLQAALPTGWSLSSATPTITVMPGSTSTAKVQILSPLSAQGVSVQALIGAASSDGATVGTFVQRDISVYTSLELSVATDKTIYAAGQTVTLLGTASANGIALSGVPVTFTILKPNGKTTVVSATTSSGGAATYSYRLNKKQDPAGNYVVNGVANVSGMSAAGSIGFQVK